MRQQNHGVGDQLTQMSLLLSLLTVTVAVTVIVIVTVIVTVTVTLGQLVNLKFS